MKRQIVTVAVVMVSVLIGMLIYQFVPLYGNDTPSIEKIIARHYDVVSIVDVNDIQNYRFVGFKSTNGKLGYAVFHKNSSHNYEWKFTEVAGAPSGIYSFFEPLPEYRDSDGRMHYATITVSSNPNLAKVKRIINDKYMDEKEISSCPSMVLLDLDIPDDSFGTTYCYYDKNGNQIHVN